MSATPEKFRAKLDELLRSGSGVPSYVVDTLRTVLAIHTPGPNDYEFERGYCTELGHEDDCDCQNRKVPTCPVCVASWAFEQNKPFPCPTVQALGVLW